MPYTRQRAVWADNAGGNTPIRAQDLNGIEAGIETAQATAESAVGGGTNPFGSTLKALSTFTGANTTAKLRDAAANYTSYGRPIVVAQSGDTIDAGANNPVVLPTGFHLMIVPGPTDEFGYQGALNVRHTGSNSGSANHGVFTFASGSKGQKFTGISFEGTSTTRCFVDLPTDASGTTMEYVHFRDCSFDSFESVMQMTGTGVIWDGASFNNNFTAVRSPFNLNGSDHQIWTNGGFMEFGGVASYSTRRSCPAMVRLGNCNMVIGPMYTTGSPTTPYRIDNGATGVDFFSVTLEGRPSPDTVGGDAPTDGLHCAGPLMRLTGGRATVKARHHAYAMRDPFSAGHGYQPGGFYHVTGSASLSVIGGTFQPYAASVYPAWTRPDGVAYPVDTVPPLGWISGSGARASFIGIGWGSNCTALPKVYAHNGAVVTTDGTVEIITV